MKTDLQRRAYRFPLASAEGSVGERYCARIGRVMILLTVNK